MKKKILAGLILSLGLMLAGCGNSNAGKNTDNATEVSQESGSKKSDNENKSETKEDKEKEKELEKAKAEVDTKYESLKDIIDAINSEKDKANDKVKADYEALLAAIPTYADYKAHPEKIDEFFETMKSDSDVLLAKFDKYYELYFKMALDTIDSNKELDRAFDDFYDDVFDDVLGDYYDVFYDEIFDDFYDDIYDDIFDEAYDNIPYKEYSEAHSNLYSKYSDAHSDIYNEYYSGREKAYVIYEIMSSNAIYGDERNFDAIMKQVDEELTKMAEERARKAAIVEVKATYEIIGDKAYVSGMAGDGTAVYIESDYQDHDVVGILPSAFEGSKLQEVHNWADLEFIGDNAFKNCTDLLEYSVASEVKVIGNSAFENCSSMKTIYLWGDPDIGERSFAGCSSLTEVSIGSDTKKVCDNAFDGCTNLARAYAWSDDTLIGKDVFANCPALERKPDESGKSVKLDSLESYTTNAPSNATKDTLSSEEPATATGIRPEFQKAMDEYVEFFEEYCNFLKTYAESDDPLELLTEYTAYKTEYSESIKALEDLKGDDLSNEEMALYLDTVNKIQQMLMEAL